MKASVIGGGLAGITAALALAQQGAEVTLLEAKPRLGGATMSFSRDGLVIDTELRWHLVRSLAAAGAGGASELIQAEHQRDPSDRGDRHAAAARASRPDGDEKAAAWSLIVEDTSQPLALVEEVMMAFHQFGQDDVLAPYGERFFQDLPRVWQTHELPDALAFGRRMYPHLAVEPATIERTDAYLEIGSVPPPVVRLLLEGRDGIERALRTRAADRAHA